MNVGLILLTQIAIMFLLIGIGFLLFKARFVTQQGSKELGNILLYVIMPSIILKSLMAEGTIERLEEFKIACLISFLVLLLSMIIARIIFGKKNKIEHFGSAFSNAGFIGIPLAQATLGNEAVLYVTPFVVMLNLLQWTYGVAVMTDDLKVIGVKQLVKNPVVLSMVAGVVVMLARIPVPHILLKTISYASEMNAPLAMIVIGAYLAQVNFKEIFKKKTVRTSSIVRLVVIPFMTILLLYLVPAQYSEMKIAILIVASAPIGSNVAVFAQKNGLDYAESVKEVYVSTVLSIITLPIIVMIGGFLWLQ